MNREKGNEDSRTELITAALFPAGLGLLGPMIMMGGRLSWLAPLLALPVGLCLCPVWRRLGRRSLGEGLKEAFGGAVGGLSAALFFLWGLILLTGSGLSYSRRLLTLWEGERGGWTFLLPALGICLWLSRRKGRVMVRMGRILFLTVAATLAAILLLSLHGMEWRNLWPPEQKDWWGLPGSAALCLSLAGYGVYGLCLPQGREGKTGWFWTVWGCGGQGAILLMVVGTFGPALAEKMGQPFLSLLEGAGIPGAFQRGEAGFMAVLTLADLALLALLSRGVMTLWAELVPVFSGMGWLPAAGAFLLAGALSGEREAYAWLMAVLPRGNLIFGVLLPVLAVLTIQVRERRKRRATFCGDRSGREADVAIDLGDKKSSIENEKKC